MRPLAFLFDSSGFPPRWACGSWTDLLGWTHIVADVTTGLSYIGIPIVLAYYFRQSRSEVPGVGWLFVAFILACGLTHLLEAVIFWVPLYRLSAVFKVCTALVSFGTVAALIWTTPTALARPDVQDALSRLVRERNQARADLAIANERLEAANRMLEAKVEARTLALRSSNEALENKILELRDAEDELRRRKAMLLEAQRMAGLGSWRFDALRDEIECSETLYEMLEVPQGTALGQLRAQVDEVLMPADQERLRRGVEHALADAQAFGFDLEVKPESRIKVRFLRIRGRPILDGSKEIVGLEGTIGDVSDEVEQQQRLHEANQRLEAAVEEATRDLKESVRELERTNADLELFIHTASHDLKGPVRNLRMVSQMLMEDFRNVELDDRARRRLEVIPKATDRLHRMIVALVDLSTTGRAQPRVAALDLRAIIEGILRDIESSSPSGPPQVELPDFPEIAADEGLVERVLANLLGNAVKFGGPPPRIAVTVEEGSSEWVFGVKDNGPGIDPAERDRIFEPFQRGAHSGDNHGVGMGLAIARRAVERQGGRIWIADSAEGAYFQFSLPRRKPEAGLPAG